MADETLNGINAFAALQGIENNTKLRKRKDAAYAALRKTYGDIAGDPEAAAALQKVDESTQAFPLQQQQREQAIAASKQTMETNAATEAEKKRNTQSNALLSGALFIQNARKRDPNADVGALFDRIAPTLALTPEAAAHTRATLVADPNSADDLVTAFRIRQGAEKGDPAAVQEYQYFSGLNPEEQANYLKVKRTNSSPEIAGSIAGAQATARQQAELNYAAPIASAKAESTAVGKAVGEKTASDLPLSNTEQVKAQQAEEAAVQSFEVADKAINDAIGESSWLSAGPLSHLPDFLNTTAAALRADLTTVQSKVVLDTISEMKALSKTGSTGFGALSDREAQLIQARLGAVLQATSPQRLKKSLTDLQTQLAASRGRVERAYVADQKARAPKAAAAPAPQGSRTEGNNVILKWNPAKGDFE